MSDELRMLVRTPHEIVVDRRVRAARVRCGDRGFVGLRPRQEAFVSVVEPGLCVLRLEPGLVFVATAGGLLEADGDAAVVYTPFAAVGEREADVLAALDRALAAPDDEIAARRRLGELEQRIVQELGSSGRAARPRSAHG